MCEVMIAWQRESKSHLICSILIDASDTISADQSDSDILADMLRELGHPQFSVLST